MNLINPEEVSTVALVGAGVIGGGWAIHFLRLGKDVVVYDPAPNVESQLRQRAAGTWPAMERIGLAEGARLDRLRFADTLEEALAGADFVLESGPEREAPKRSVITAIDAALPADVVIASSTSGIPMTYLQADCNHPERCIVAHPFNPPYLIPLVEIVPGAQTSRQVADWAVEFFNLTGKMPLRLEKEYPAFLANRLLEAVWREALHLVNDGLATVEEIDTAMTYAPALRWAIMGPFMIYHLAGGDGGMRHFLDHFGPSLDLPWSYMQGPELTPELRDRIVAGCERMAAGRPVGEIARERDECLIAVLETLERCRT